MAFASISITISLAEEYRSSSFLLDVNNFQTPQNFKYIDVIDYNPFPNIKRLNQDLLDRGRNRINMKEYGK
jgi:hypothetical protein